MVIRKTYDNSDGLNSNYINSITQDEKGRIVLGTNKSLLILNGKRFSNVPMLDSRNKPINTYVTQVSRLHNGDIAVVTSGYGIRFWKTNKKGSGLSWKTESCIGKKRTASLFHASWEQSNLTHKISGKTTRATFILLPRMMVFTFSRQVQPSSPR